MANVNLARGFVPLKDAAGKPYNGAVEMFYHAATDGTALYIGDPVVKAGSADSAGVPTVIRASAGGPISGVVQGFMPDGTTNMAGYGAASTGYYVLCATDPDLVYEIQEDAVGGAIAAADIGLNASMIAAAGSSTTKRSGFMLDTSTKATTAGLELKIMGLTQRPDNALSANAKVLVKINNHTDSNVVAGV